MTPRAPASTAEDTRHRILDTARELFAAQGVEATTMRTIGKRLGLTAAAIYHHFADKDALIRELVATDLQRLGAAFARAQRVADPIERLHALGMEYVRFGLEHPQHYRLLFMTPDFKSRVADDIQRLMEAAPERDAYGILRTCVEAAIGTGRLRPEYRDPEQVSQALWASVHGIVSLHIVFSDQPWLEWRDTVETADLAMRAQLAGICLERPGVRRARG